MVVIWTLLRLLFSTLFWLSRWRAAANQARHDSLKLLAVQHTPKGDGDMTDRALEWAAQSAVLLRIANRMRAALSRRDRWTWRELQAERFCQMLCAVRKAPVMAFMAGVLSSLEGVLAYNRGGEAWSWCCENAARCVEMASETYQRFM